MVRLLPRHICRVLPGQRRHAHETPIERRADSKAAREGEVGLQGEVLQPLGLRLVLLVLVLQGAIIAKAPPVVHVLARDGLRSVPTLHGLRQSASWRWATAENSSKAVVQGHKGERVCMPQAVDSSCGHTGQ